LLLIKIVFAVQTLSDGVWGEELHLRASDSVTAIEVCALERYHG
jgi:hypothetical protein